MRITNRFAPFWFLVLAALGMCRFSWAVDYEVNMSSNPITTGTLAVIPRTDPGDILGKLTINTRAQNTETIKLYDSSGTATNLIATIDLSTGTAPTGGEHTFNEYLYGLRISSGITYTRSGITPLTSDITIFWKDVR